MTDQGRHVKQIPPGIALWKAKEAAETLHSFVRLTEGPPIDREEFERGLGILEDTSSWIDPWADKLSVHGSHGPVRLGIGRGVVVVGSHHAAVGILSRLLPSVARLTVLRSCGLAGPLVSGTLVRECLLRMGSIVNGASVDEATEQELERVDNGWLDAWLTPFLEEVPFWLHREIRRMVFELGMPFLNQTLEFDGEHAWVNKEEVGTLGVAQAGVLRKFIEAATREPGRWLTLSDLKEYPNSRPDNTIKGMDRRLQDLIEQNNKGNRRLRLDVELILGSVSTG